MKNVSKLILAGLTCALSAAAIAGPTCTQEPQAKWMNQAQFKQQLSQQGYQIKKFKVTDGKCYEIYGKNKEGQRVEIYFNPITAKAVKTEIDD